jgi:hypothetical protein
LKFLNSQADLSQLTSFLEQQKSLNEFLSQQQQSRIACPEHADMPNLAEIDCKSCEFLNMSQMSPMRSASKSPMKGFHESNSSSKTSSPITSATPNSTSQQQLQMSHQMGGSGQSINTSPSFTIGACPDHMNGRPLGVECARWGFFLNF